MRLQLVLMLVAIGLADAYAQEGGEVIPEQPTPLPFGKLPKVDQDRLAEGVAPLQPRDALARPAGLAGAAQEAGGNQNPQQAPMGMPAGVDTYVGQMVRSGDTLEARTYVETAKGGGLLGPAATPRPSGCSCQ